MSSRLFPGGSEDAIPIAWSPAGSDSSIPGLHFGAAKSSAPPSFAHLFEQHAAKGNASGGAQNEGASEGLEARLHASFEKGRAEGRVEGEAIANQLAGELAGPVLNNFGNIVRELAAARQQARHEAEDSMVKLALAIARRILQREISTDPEAVLGLVRTGLDRVNARETHRLRLAPGDAQIVLDNRADLSLPAAVEVVADATLAPGSAIFETSRGELDVSTQTQLLEIERGFADLMVRRNK
jgi:flagellar assembly protein FliH